MAEVVELSVEVRENARGLSKNEFRKALVDSIIRGDYKIPEGIAATIHLTEASGEEKSWDNWTEAMQNSAQFGTGFDSMMLRYLGEPLLREPMEEEEVVAEEEVEAREEVKEERKKPRRKGRKRRKKLRRKPRKKRRGRR